MAMIASGGGGGPTRAPKPKPTSVSRGVAAVVAPVSHVAQAIAHTIAPPAIAAAPTRRPLPPRDSSSGQFVSPASHPALTRLAKAVAKHPGTITYSPDSALRNPILRAVSKVRDPVLTNVFDLTNEFALPPPPNIVTGPQGEFLYRQPSGPDRMATSPPISGTYRVPLMPANPLASRGRFAKPLQREHGLQRQALQQRRSLI